MSTFKNVEVDLTFTMKYPGNKTFSFGNLILDANNDKIIQVADAINSLQVDAYTSLIKSQKARLYYEI